MNAVLSADTLAILQRLDELLAIQNRGRFSDPWVDLDDLATYFKFSPSHVRARIVSLPDFPLSFGGGHPRWLFSEVREWAKHHRRSP